jgi:ribonucleoside-triphosphate reductase
LLNIQNPALVKNIITSTGLVRGFAGSRIHQLNNYQQYIHKSRYARWNDEAGRRETWDETVARYVDFWSNRFGDLFPAESIRASITNLEVMPSMRALMSAGPALEKDNIAGYNCSYVAIDNQRCFDEIMYILMCGTGVGFSVERQYIASLPTIAEEFHTADTTIVVPDSRIGWASSFRDLISLLYSGRVPGWDLSRLRPAGAILKTFGGRSSGPEPLDQLFTFAVGLFKKAAGRKLTSLEVHDLVCKIGDIVVMGGVRRSALISLSNLSDERMRGAKSGQWWIEHGERALANNSAVYSEKPEIGTFMKEWVALYESKSGERGIFNRDAATRQAASSGRREIDGIEFGTNPCGEIILRSCGLCNLSEAVVRPDDSYEDVKRKVELATIIGTFQSTLSDFRYVRSVWKRNAEEERLLGVSLTGIMDHPVLSGIGEWGGSQGLKDALEDLKQHAIRTNEIWADKLGVARSAAITTVKPSGTVSQLVDSSSGIHPRMYPYYLRTVRSDKTDPLGQTLKDQGLYHEDDVTKPTTDVFYFPIKSPVGAVTTKDVNAIQQLEHYLVFRNHWCEHNPSITVYVREHEWMDVGAWVYEHFDELGGVSFLPLTDHVYKQAPYQEITEEEYEVWAGKTPEINWGRLREFETRNTTTIQPELSCSAGVCEL